jgi:hypothetical protein
MLARFVSCILITTLAVIPPVPSADASLQPTVRECEKLRRAGFDKCLIRLLRRPEYFNITRAEIPDAQLERFVARNRGEILALLAQVEFGRALKNYLQPERGTLRAFPTESWTAFDRRLEQAKRIVELLKTITRVLNVISAGSASLVSESLEVLHVVLSGIQIYRRFVDVLFHLEARALLDTYFGYRSTMAPRDAWETMTRVDQWQVFVTRLKAAFRIEDAAVWFENAYQAFRLVAQPDSPGLRSDIGRAIAVQAREVTVSVQPAVGPPGTAFMTVWRGFTPNSTLRSHLRKPDGTRFPPLVIRTDREGTAKHVIDSKGFHAGRYYLWGVDEVTDRSTPHVTFQVQEPSSPAGVGVYGELTVNRLVDSGKTWGVLSADAVIKGGEVHGAGGQWTVITDRESPADVAKRHVLNQVKEFDVFDRDTLQLVGSFRVEKVGVCPLLQASDCDPDSPPDPHVNFVRGFGSVQWTRQPDFSRWTTYTRYQDSQYVPDRQVARFLAASREICTSVRRMDTGRRYWVADWVKRVCGVSG